MKVLSIIGVIVFSVLGFLFVDGTLRKSPQEYLCHK